MVWDPTCIQNQIYIDKKYYFTFVCKKITIQIIFENERFCLPKSTFRLISEIKQATGTSEFDIKTLM